MPVAVNIRAEEEDNIVFSKVLETFRILNLQNIALFQREVLSPPPPPETKMSLGNYLQTRFRMNA
jgi:hypothetical protein